MNHRTRLTALTIATGIAGAALSVVAHACPTDAYLRAANSAASADAFTQFAGTVKAEQQATLDHLGGPTVNTILGSGNARSSIVGFWKFAWTAPDGIHGIDWGFQTWHDDGTELTNSGNQLPATGNFCSGTWAQDATGAYHLNHWAIAWNLPGTDPSNLAGLINIRETVSVDRSGNSMAGTVSLDLYAPDGTTHLAHLVDGTVAATRVTP